MPPQTIKLKGISMGHLAACAISATPLSSGSNVTCWGGYLTASVPNGLSATALGVSDRFRCAVKTDSHEVVCWGDNTGPGQPNRAPAGLRATQLDGDGGFMCAVTMEQTIRCWGTTAFPPPSDLKAIRVSAADFHVCAQKPDRTVTCWGKPGLPMTGQLDVPPETTYRWFSAGGMGGFGPEGQGHTCLIKDDYSVQCIGKRNENTLMRPPAGMKALLLDSNGDQTCAIKLDGSPSCWGANVKGLHPTEILRISDAGRAALQ